MGHVVLISPIITGLTISALRGVPPEIKETALSLGADRMQTIYTIVKEAKYGVTTAALLGFGRRRFRDRTGYNCWRQHQRVHQDSDYGHVPGDVYRKL